MRNEYTDNDDNSCDVIGADVEATRGGVVLNRGGYLNCGCNGGAFTVQARKKKKFMEFYMLTCQVLLYYINIHPTRINFGERNVE